MGHPEEGWLRERIQHTLAGHGVGKSEVRAAQKRGKGESINTRGGQPPGSQGESMAWTTRGQATGPGTAARSRVPWTCRSALARGSLPSTSPRAPRCADVSIHWLQHPCSRQALRTLGHALNSSGESPGRLVRPLPAPGPSPRIRMPQTGKK